MTQCLLCVGAQRYMREESSDVRELFALMERMLEYDPDERVGLSESLEHPFFTVLPDALLLHRRNPPPAAASSSPPAGAASTSTPGAKCAQSPSQSQSAQQSQCAGNCASASNNQIAPMLAITPTTAGSSLSSLSASATGTPTAGLLYGSLGTRV